MKYNQRGIAKKRKKSFFKRGWFILLVVIEVIAIVRSIDGVEREEEKIFVWSDMLLGDILPEPPVNKGDIHNNSTNELWINIEDVSNSQYAQYVKACRDKGFTIDEESGFSDSFKAYNDQGYRLSLEYIFSLEIHLEAPMQLDNISWPDSTAGKLLPVPKSTIGKFSSESDDGFSVDVGNTSKDDFAAYVSACSDNGFNIDYDKGDTYYYADNADGWHISLTYEGGNIMSIDIDSPDHK